jgi:hypothetical protein
MSRNPYWTGVAVFRYAGRQNVRSIDPHITKRETNHGPRSAVHKLRPEGTDHGAETLLDARARRIIQKSQH